MNDEMKNQLAEVLRKAISIAEKTGEFVISQAPELLKEFYRWEIISSIFLIVIGIIAFIIGRYLPYLWLSKKKQSGMFASSFFGRHSNDDCMGCWVLFTLGLIFSFITTSVGSYTILYISFAPKLYLINYFLN